MSFRITIISDVDNWLNDYIPELVNEIEKGGHVVCVVHKPEEISSGDFVFYLGCGKIVPRSVLEKNRHNLVLHASDLPKGKGWSPHIWQILEGKNEIPVCIFDAVEELDNGKIYFKEMCKYNGNELIDEIRKILSEVIMRMCLRFVREYPVIAEKGLARTGEPTFYRKRTREDSRLDPNKTIKEQFNLLRVVDNDRYPAFFEINGKKYILKIENA